MAIRPICDMCGKELERFGALLFSPPGMNGTVMKYHICTECFESLEGRIRKASGISRKG
ncbi:MAG: hypothetical protein KGH94_00300 [Candidatus Micrarchaeota archaeon]|nr:hypothetical protein [Candidatus Micrarchaeota archaeon]